VSFLSCRKGAKKKVSFSLSKDGPRGYRSLLGKKRSNGFYAGSERKSKKGKKEVVKARLPEADFPLVRGWRLESGE